MTSLFAAESERLIHGHANGMYSNRSFFLWLSLNAPHVPLQAPEEWMQRQRSDLDPNVRTYAAMVGAMDDAFGRAASALRAAGMFRTSLIIFMSDNGGPIIPAVCNGGLRGGKGSPYDGGFRAPAFVFWPECLGSKRRVSRISAHMVDIFATLAVAASAGQPRATQQRVLLKLKRKSPHSVSLWNGLVGGGGSGGGGGGGSGSDGSGSASAGSGSGKSGRGLSSSGSRGSSSSSGVGGGVGAGPAMEAPELARRMIVLQVGFLLSTSLHGCYSCPLAATPCPRSRPICPTTPGERLFILSHARAVEAGAGHDTLFWDTGIHQLRV